MAALTGSPNHRPSELADGSELLTKQESHCSTFNTMLMTIALE